MMGTALDAAPVVAVATPVQGAPAPQDMLRSDMDGRMNEVQSGCYAARNMPCCFLAYISVKETQLHVGPCCACCGVCCCPCPPGMCGNYKQMAPGSASFKETTDGGIYTFVSPKTFKANGGMGNAKDEMHCRVC